MFGVHALRRLFDWLTLRDYEQADDAATVQVVKRYSRGNVNVQGGRFLSAAEMEARALDMAKRLPRLKAKYKALAGRQG